MLGRELLAPLAAADPAIPGHHVHRLRVFLATCTTWLEGHDPRWLTELRGADEALHRASLDRLYGRPPAPGIDEGALAAAHQGRLRDALRAADRLTFGERQVDLHGARLLTGLDGDALRAAIACGALAASDDGEGPLVAIDALARLAEERGLEWRDGLADPAAGDAREASLAVLLGGRAGEG
ncbi:MAG: hypothetical protein H6710_01425 [Myxococcales bacterium]|nr:hypothetical protein [Myxococcales bacterium]